MGFGIDMSKAKDIHKKNIRNARAPKLSELDIEYQRATETSADTSAIVAKKQALRDAPAAAGVAIEVPLYSTYQSSLRLSGASDASCALQDLT